METNSGGQATSALGSLGPVGAFLVMALLCPMLTQIQVCVASFCYMSVHAMAARLRARLFACLFAAACVYACVCVVAQRLCVFVFACNACASVCFCW
jgi:hypothetical protein